MNAAANKRTEPEGVSAKQRKAGGTYARFRTRYESCVKPVLDKALRNCKEII